MPKSAAALSNQLQSRWQRWGVYWTLLGVSIFLLVAEQSGAVRFLWDFSRATTQPGVILIQQAQATQRGVGEWIGWRRSVLDRLAATEQELLQADLRQAQLTVWVEELDAQVNQAPGAGIVDHSAWQPSVWEGIPGSWQVRAGCRDGMQGGDPVITPEGILVGSITDVQTYYSHVISWDTPGWSVPARVGTASAVAIVQSTSGAPQVAGLRWPATVSPGDSVLTAGSQTVPRNLFIGTVDTLSSQEAFGEVTGTIRVPLESTRVQAVMVPAGRGDTCLSD